MTSEDSWFLFFIWYGLYVVLVFTISDAKSVKNIILILTKLHANHVFYEIKVFSKYLDQQLFYVFANPLISGLMHSCTFTSALNLGVKNYCCSWNMGSPGCAESWKVSKLKPEFIFRINLVVFFITRLSLSRWAVLCQGSCDAGSEIISGKCVCFDFVVVIINYLCVLVGGVVPEEASASDPLELLRRLRLGSLPRFMLKYTSFSHTSTLPTPRQGVTMQPWLA